MRVGTDVVVGVVETHGRAETEALTRGYEVIPRKDIAHQGHMLREMDIDAILARHPQLVLVDEFAHINAPGRHPKRYQDVEELLAAGIDVFSTINIQHIESLNDVVASFTHVRVRETVPDRILELAEIEVVDLPPDELIEWLCVGEVYVPEEATRALAQGSWIVLAAGGTRAARARLSCGAHVAHAAIAGSIESHRLAARRNRLPVRQRRRRVPVRRPAFVRSREDRQTLAPPQRLNGTHPWSARSQQESD